MEKFNFEKLCKEFGTSVSDVSLDYKELAEKFTPYYEALTGVNSYPQKTLEYYKLLAEISKVDLAYLFKKEQRLFISSNKSNITRMTEEKNIELEQTIAGNFESEKVKDALENYLACQEDLETEKLVVDIMKDDYNNYVELLIKNKSGECSKKEKSQLKKLIDKREVAYFQAKVHRLRMEYEKDATEQNRQRIINAEKKLFEVKNPALDKFKTLFANLGEYVKDLSIHSSSSYTEENENDLGLLPFVAASTFVEAHLIDDD